LPAVFSFTAAPLQMLALIKPQFEAGRAQAKKGIVRDEAVHQAICDDIAAFAAAQGCTDIEVFPSAIEGGDGNREFFLGAKRG
jgi:23S rRNA (cytidine1920-2'-O)/16S rRNA (cytidine1409-2'-O)-methyltransferase